MHSGERWRLGHRPALDGLRGVAILLVLVAHFGVPGLHEAGAAGVTMFFTLSGFLITAGLLEERSRGSVSLARFYLRRTTRLAPALILCVSLALLVEWMVVGRVRDWSLALGALTWSSNFVMAHAGWQDWAQTPLSQTWSLAIEEQFYLVWPVLLLGLVAVSRRAAVAVTIALVLGSFAIGGSVSFEHRYLMLDARACHLLVGALLAILLVGARDRRVSSSWAMMPLAVIVVLVLLDNPAAGVADLVALSTAGLLYVVAQCDVGLLTVGPLRWLGERSYGVYLYHVPVLMLVGQVGGPWWIRGVLAAVVTLPLAAYSYRVVEEPIRAWGRSRHPRHAAQELIRRDPTVSAAPG